MLTGEEAYEGLTAIWEDRFAFDAQTCHSDVRGVIVEGEMPAAARVPETQSDAGATNE